VTPCGAPLRWAAAGGREAGAQRAFVLPSMLPLLSSPRGYFFLHGVGRCVTWP
jgi:hypothetical protein